VGRIVVGVDGSEAAREAVRFAAAEARLRGATLVAVHAWRIPVSVAMPEPAVAGYPIVHEPALEEIRAGLQEHGERALDEALAGIEGVPVERLVVEGAPAAALLEAAEDADLLVVGSRGLGGFRGLLLGSVSQQCASHASCPVAVVRT
jgi:nucleotide-binding universal stress UspA family protein